MPMRTTLTIDDSLMAEVKALMRKSGGTFRGTMEEVVRRGIAAIRERRKKPRPYVPTSWPLGIREGLSIDDIQGLFDQIDGPGRLR